MSTAACYRLFSHNAVYGAGSFTELFRSKDINLRLSTLPPPRGAASTRLSLSNSPSAPELVLGQLASLRDLINQSLDIIDVSTWTGDPLDASFISGQLHLLHENLAEARNVLKGESEEITGKWWETSADENVSFSAWTWTPI